MKYLSEKTKKFYDTPEACIEAEQKWDEEQAQLKAKREAAIAEKRDRAAAIEAAYKEMEEAESVAAEKRNNFIKLRNQFVKDYGSFHMSVHKESPVGMRPSEMDEIGQILRFFFG